MRRHLIHLNATSKALEDFNVRTLKEAFKTTKILLRHPMQRLQGQTLNKDTGILIQRQDALFTFPTVQQLEILMQLGYHRFTHS